MDRISLRGTPIWARLVAVVGVFVAVITAFGVFFGMSGLLFSWLNGATRGTLPNQNMPSWGVPVGRILYASDWEGSGFDLYLQKQANNRAARITTNDADDINPSFSPDGNQIVFQSNRDGGDNLYIIDVNGGNEYALTDDANANWHPDWSPDGSQIVFSAKDADGVRHLYLIDIDGDNLTQLTTSGDDTQPMWSPDGTQIAFIRTTVSSVDLYVINADGTDETAIVSESGLESDPRWSPSGQQIGVVITGSAGASAVYIVDPDGENLWVFQQAFAATTYACPVWSPDGQHMSLVWGQTGSPYQNMQIYSLNNTAYSGWAGMGSGSIIGCDWTN